MKSLFLLSLLCLSLDVFAQQEDAYCKQFTSLVSQEQEAFRRRQAHRYYKETASASLDVHYYRCEWTVDPALRAIAGKVTIYFTPRTSLSTITFDLMDQLVTDSVSRKGISIPFLRDGHTLNIDPGVTISAGSLDSVSISYHGVPGSTGFGSFMQSTHNGTPVVWTLSEPYGAREWWPCSNGLGDKADSLDVLITCPVAYKGVSNGLRQSELISADGIWKTTHWKHRYPIATYLICLAVTDYTEFNHSVRLDSTDLPIQTFCYPESLALFRDNIQPTLDAMQLFHHLLGPYPFIREKYGHTQFSWGGGMEHQTNSFMVHTDASLAAHELAHQWFGDKITCGSWEEIWLNEGFATYLASLFIEQRNPSATLTLRRVEIDRITSSPGGSVRVDDTTSLSRIFDNRLTYLKGSHLLYMLRWKLGDEAFFKGVRTYLEDPGLRYRFAHTEDLQRHLEAAGGQDLDIFFDQWYRGQGYPSYQLQWAQIGAGTVRIRVSHKTSHPSVSYFQLPVPVLFKNATEQKLVRVDNTYDGELFVRDIGFIADTAIIDPEYLLISRDNQAISVDDIRSSDKPFVVYPNPTGEDFQLMINELPGPYVYVQLYDISGRKLWQERRDLYRGREFLHIPAAHLGSGVYILRILDGKNQVYTEQLLKRQR